MNLTTSQIATTVIPASETWLQTIGHTTPDDGGHAVFTLGVSDGHALSIQGTDGRYWNPPAQPMNIRMFGAHPNKTKAQNKAAIQNALAYAAYKGAKVNITRGLFQIDPIDFGAGLFLDGDGKGSILKGNFAGPLFKRVGGSAGQAGPTKFSNFSLINENNAGRGIHATVGINFILDSLFFDCRFNAVQVGPDAFTTLIQSCVARGYGAIPGSIGFICGGHTTVDTNDITGWDVGVRSFHTGGKVTGNRVEICRTGIQVGYNELGQVYPTTGVGVENNSLEANGVQMHIRKLVGGNISGNRAHGGNNGPTGQTAVGMNLAEIEGTTVTANFMGNGYSDAAIKASAKWKNCVVQANTVQNTISTGKRWDIDGFAHENCLLEPNAA